MRFTTPKGGAKLISDQVGEGIESWFRIVRADGKIEKHCVRACAGDGKYVITDLKEGDTVQFIDPPIFGEIKTTLFSR